VPTQNSITQKDNEAFRWYGKRAKLYAALQRFVYQNGNLENEEDDDTVVETAHHFASRIAQDDFWDGTELWEVIGHFGGAVRHFLTSGDATALKLEPRARDPS
jgi:hypothetical protein